MLNILEIIVEIISGSLGSDTLSAIATVTEIPVSTLRISLAVSVIILAIEIIIKLFLGIKGLSAVNGNSIGKAPIILVKIGIVLMLISFIEDIIHAFSGSLNIISVAINTDIFSTIDILSEICEEFITDNLKVIVSYYITPGTK